MQRVVVQHVRIKRKIKELNIKVKISKAKRMKSNFTGRLGVKVEQVKLSSNFTIHNLIKEPINQILKEVAPADSVLYDIHMQETNNSMKKKPAVEE